MDALGQKRLGDGAMQVVRCHDGGRTDAVGARRLGCRHIAEIAIGPVRVDADFNGLGMRPHRIGRESTGDEVETSIQPCGHAVNAADERALTGPDHSEF